MRKNSITFLILYLLFCFHSFGQNYDAEILKLEKEKRELQDAISRLDSKIRVLRNESLGATKSDNNFRNYIMSSVGWCYYINSNGVRIYVDQSFCSSNNTNLSQSNLVSSSIDAISNGKSFKSRKELVQPIESTVKTTVDVDDFSGKKMTKTETWNGFAKGYSSMSGSAFLNEESGIVSFTMIYMGDLGCMVELSSEMKIKLSNDTVVPMIYVSDTDCGDYNVGSWIALSKDDLENPNFKEVLEENLFLLKSYDWVKIRIYGSEVYSDLEPKVSRKIPNPEQFFRQHLIAVESKLQN